MKRKIIRLCKETFVVSIPKKWKDKFNIEKGDEIEIKEEGKKLVLSLEKNSFPKRKSIKVTKKDVRFFKRIFFIFGSLGYDEIEIIIDSSDQFEKLNEASQHFPSFVLIEQKENSFIYKVFMKEVKEDFFYMLEKIFNVTKNLANNFLKFLKEKNYKKLEKLLFLEKTNDQLVLLTQRFLINEGYIDQEKTCFAYLLLHNLGVIADFYRRCCSFLSSEIKKDVSLSDDLLYLIEKTNNLFNILVDLPKNDIEKNFIDLFELKAKIGDEMDSIFLKGKYEEIVVGHYIMDIITYIQDASIFYFGLIYSQKTKNI
ncbi:MAG: AbrB/MazE/SpoVT family DNA-binding domain-containing protein [Candidatus Pacearchaeota archaeon]